MDKEEIDNVRKAGKIAREAVEYARGIVKKGESLLDIAEKIEKKIVELGGRAAFPVNLSINEIAAHSTPSYNDDSKAYGLLKVDIGVHIGGYVGDTAFAVDLEGDEESKKLILAAEAALHAGVEKIGMGVKIREIGVAIEKACKTHGVQSIRNLSGHSIERYNLHSGLTIPNFDNFQDIEIEEGVYAIEPFTTMGDGAVRDGRLSGIYHLEGEGGVRDKFAREVLEFINEEYMGLPFCSRWIHKKFGTRGLLALRQIEQAKILHHYPQLIERSGRKVAQAENSVLLVGKEKWVVTK